MTGLSKRREALGRAGGGQKEEERGGARVCVPPLPMTRCPPGREAKGKLGVPQHNPLGCGSAHLGRRQTAVNQDERV